MILCLGLEELPETVSQLKVETQLIQMVDMSLKSKGYSARQTLKI